jgi:hypothetical protein
MLVKNDCSLASLWGITLPGGRLATRGLRTCPQAAMSTSISDSIVSRQGPRYVCCLAPEDGQGSGSAGQPRISRPLHGIRPKASKGLIRRRRVLHNPHHGFESHRRLLVVRASTRNAMGLPGYGRPIALRWLQHSRRTIAAKQARIEGAHSGQGQEPHQQDDSRAH